jgi:uncharacterized protein YwgA
VDQTLELTPRQKTLLVFLGADGGEKLDPIRVQKGLFILAEETPPDWLPSEARYRFEPYHYGPYSSALYSDLDELVHRGYVETTQVLGRSWDYYSLNSEGARIYQEVSEAMDPKAVEYSRKVREFIGKLSFRKLLTTVYEQYPDYAVNSVFK